MSEAEEELWKPHYVNKPVVEESVRGEPLGEMLNSETYFVWVVAADGSKQCSASPSCVKVYNTDEVLLVGDELNGNEIFDFIPEDRKPAEEVLLKARGTPCQ